MQLTSYYMASSGYTYVINHTQASKLIIYVHTQPNSKMKGAIYEIPYKDCPYVYIGETGRTLEKCLSEYKTAVRWNDPKNGIAVHAINCEAASVKREERS